MLESQKMSAENFIIGFKHGIYIITNDACQICEDYKREIIEINSAHLHFVEAVTDADRQAIKEIVGRGGFPLTVGFWMNQVRFVKGGILYGKERIETFKFLEKFPDRPLKPEELEELKRAVSRVCKLALYLFPPGTDETARKRALNESYEHDELPIDVDEALRRADPSSDLTEKMRLFRGVVGFSKLVVFDIFTTSDYGEVGTELMKMKLEDAEYGKAPIEYRTLQEAT
jgi:hypothetical protein